MNKDLFTLMTGAMVNKPSANFSEEDINTSALNCLLSTIGCDANTALRDVRQYESAAFALIEEAVDAILAEKLNETMGQFAEIKVFPRDAQILFNVDKIGKNRAKLTVSKGARGGIYRAARLDSGHFELPTITYTAAVYCTLEELILGKITLNELFLNIVEGFQDIVFREIFNALSTSTPAVGVKHHVTTTKADITKSIDSVLPIIQGYGVPTIFGFYNTVSLICNPLAAASGYPNGYDSADIRNYGFVQVYKGVKVVQLPNYILQDNGDTNVVWAYASNYLFVMPSGAKPVKVGFRGDLLLEKNKQATGSVKWEASKNIGVGIVMANNYAVVKVTDLN